MLLDGDGRPVCTEMWPGNTADIGSLIPAIGRLQRRFRINRVCVVADRGMISAETIAELEARKLLYVLGVRERTDKLVRDLVLDDPAPFVPFVLIKERREVDYEAKAVKLAGRRYIVCRNLDEMSKDAANRATIVAALERQLKKGDKSLVGNKGYRRFLANPQGDGFAIDRVKVEEDAKFDRGRAGRQALPAALRPAPRALTAPASPCRRPCARSHTADQQHELVMSCHGVAAAWICVTCQPLDFADCRRSARRRPSASTAERSNGEYQAAANYFLIIAHRRRGWRGVLYNGKMPHLQKVCGKRRHAVPASARTCPARLALGRSCLCTLRLASGYRLRPVNCCASHPRLSDM